MLEKYRESLASLKIPQLNQSDQSQGLLNYFRIQFLGIKSNSDFHSEDLTYFPDIKPILAWYDKSAQNISESPELELSKRNELLTPHKEEDSERKGLQESSKMSQNPFIQYSQKNLKRRTTMNQQKSKLNRGVTPESLPYAFQDTSKYSHSDKSKQEVDDLNASIEPLSQDQIKEYSQILDEVFQVENKFTSDRSSDKKLVIQNAIKSGILSRILEVSEYSLEFNTCRFFLIYSYHVLFFFLGPFSLPIISAFSGRGLPVNMAFLPTTQLKPSLFIQYFQWLSYTTLLYIMYKSITHPDTNLHNKYSMTHTGLYWEQFLYLILQIQIRSFIIAVRYAYCSPLRYQLLKTRCQEFNFLQKDLMYTSWHYLDPKEGLWREIKAVMWRHQTEEALFRFKVIEKMDEEFQKRLTDVDQLLNYMACMHLDFTTKVNSLKSNKSLRLYSSSQIDNMNFLK